MASDDGTTALSVIILIKEESESQGVVLTYDHLLQGTL